MERRTAVPAEAAQLPALTQFLQDFWSACGLPSAGLPAFELALEEVFINIVLRLTTGHCPHGQCRSRARKGTSRVLEDDGPGSIHCHYRRRTLRRR
jgi:hypothetical protein